MKREQRRGWQMVWASVGLLVLNCLLGYLVQSPEALGLNSILFYGLVIILCVIDLAAVYILARRFFGKKE